MQDTARLPEAFFLVLEALLLERPDGWSEQALIRRLQAEGFFSFLPPPPAPPELLYRAHFLLHHALYRLADRWAARAEARLETGPVRIRRLPWRDAGRALSASDGLRDYYLDWRNLDDLDTADVDALIASFWARLRGVAGRAEALAELGLADPVDDAAIKRAWRRLAMRHHPDRGGDTARLQRINAAVARLLEGA